MDTTKKGKGLPPYFKFIGVGVAIAAFLIPVFLKVMDVLMEDETKGWVKTVCVDVIKIGLMLIILSRDKVEDERKGYIRMICFMFVAIYAVVISILDSYFNLIFDFMELTVNKLVFHMLLIYLFTFYWYKRQS